MWTSQTRKYFFRFSLNILNSIVSFDCMAGENCRRSHHRCQWISIHVRHHGYDDETCHLRLYHYTWTIRYHIGPLCRQSIDERSGLHCWCTRLCDAIVFTVHIDLSFCRLYSLPKLRPNVIGKRHCDYAHLRFDAIQCWRISCLPSHQVCLLPFLNEINRIQSIPFFSIFVHGLFLAIDWIKIRLSIRKPKPSAGAKHHTVDQYRRICRKSS